MKHNKISLYSGTSVKRRWSTFTDTWTQKLVSPWVERSGWRCEPEWRGLWVLHEASTLHSLSPAASPPAARTQTWQVLFRNRTERKRRPLKLKSAYLTDTERQEHKDWLENRKLINFAKGFQETPAVVLCKQQTISLIWNDVFQNHFRLAHQLFTQVQQAVKTTT